VLLKGGEWVARPWDPEKYDWLRSVQFQTQAQGEFKDLYIDNCRLEGQDQYIGMEL